MRVTAALLGIVVAFACRAADHTINGRAFTLPEGFTIELVAGPPLVTHPVHAAFDDKGRLLVTEVSGTNAPITEQLKTLPHKVLRLTDDNGDGKFDRSEVWAKELPLPQGILWYQGAAYVAAPPAIWKLQSNPDDTGSLPKTAWYNPGTATGCNNDLHGPWLGPDGWFYWTKGAFAEQTHELTNGKKFATKASMLLRRRPEGGPVDVLMTGGMDNPVGLAFLPNGERIVAGTFYHHPHAGLRDGLIHALYGGVYGKDHNVLDGLPRTGPLLPVMTDLGPAAPCSVICYEGNGLSKAFKEDPYVSNLFLCQFNLHKLSRHEVSPNLTYCQTRDYDFLSTPNIDFHPTDVVQDADGSLLVIDTGGWYKLCCPTSQLAKPEVPGAIYRIRLANTHAAQDPRGLKIDWKEAADETLVKLLDDDRPTVAWRAVEEAAKRGTRIAPRLLQRAQVVDKQAIRSWGRSNLRAVWALGRIEGNVAEAAVEAIADVDSFAFPRSVAFHLMALHCHAKSIPQLLKKEQYPPSYLAAYELMGRAKLDSPEVIEALLNMAHFILHTDLENRTHQHGIRYALWEMDSPSLIEQIADAPNRHARSIAAALWAVSQNPKWQAKRFTVDRLLSWAEHPEPELAAAARFALQQRKEFAEQGISWLRKRLDGKPRSDPGWDALRPLLATWLSRANLQQLLLEWCVSPDAGVRLYCWSLLSETPGKWLYPSWVEVAKARVESGDAAELGAILKVIHRSPPTTAPLIEALKRRSADYALPGELRFAIVALWPPAETSDASFAELLASLAPSQPASLRGAAAEVLSKATLSVRQLETLANVLKVCSPLEIEQLLPAFTRTPTPEVGQTLVAALMSAKARKALQLDDLRKRLKVFGLALQPAAEKLFAKFAEDKATETKRLEQLLATLPAGDVKRGLVVFNGTKASCRACHKLGYVGGDLAPDLSKIGSIRTRRDLLESIVFPSASFVRSYEPTLFQLKDGRTANGLIRKETATEILLATGVNKEERLVVSDVESRQPGTVSIMPAGMDQQLTPQELADLLAFLQSAK